MNLPLIALLLICSFPGLSQVRHNFEVKSGNTDCHELPASFESSQQAIQEVRSSTFRFEQSIKISRFRSPLSANFYSCDGEKGYLIAHELNNVHVIYGNFPKTVWDAFITSEDPIHFYANEIKQVYKAIE